MEHELRVIIMWTQEFEPYNTSKNFVDESFNVHFVYEKWRPGKGKFLVLYHKFGIEAGDLFTFYVPGSLKVILFKPQNEFWGVSPHLTDEKTVSQSRNSLPDPT